MADLCFFATLIRMEYKATRGKTISHRIIGLVFISFGIFMLSIKDPVISDTAATVVTVIASLLILGAVRVYLGTVGVKLTVDGDYITLTHLFRSRSIRVDAVDSYRYGPFNSFYLMLKQDGKRLRVPRVLASNKEVISWVTGRFPEFDRKVWEKELTALSENKQFGSTAGERDGRLKKAAGLEWILTMVAAFLLLWSLLYPHPMAFIMLLLFLTPWVGVYFTGRFGGMLKLYKKRRSPYPSLIAVMAIPVVGAGILLPTYHVYEFPQQAWTMLLAGAFLFAVTGIFVCRKGFSGARFKILTGVCFILVVGIYSYFLLLFSNCYFDESLSTVSKVQVTGKRTTSGKMTNYYISISSWGHYTEGEEINVVGSLYRSVNMGDSVNVSLQSGKWDIPWYFLTLGPQNGSP
jgi:hypothetical protein